MDSRSVALLKCLTDSHHSRDDLTEERGTFAQPRFPLPLTALRQTWPTLSNCDTSLSVQYLTTCSHCISITGYNNIDCYVSTWSVTITCQFSFFKVTPKSLCFEFGIFLYFLLPHHRQSSGFVFTEG